MRIVEHLADTDRGLENQERLIRVIENYMKKDSNIASLTTNQTVRFLKVFAEAGDVNMLKYSIVDKLISNIEKNIQEIEDSDVIYVLQAYKYLDLTIPKSGKLFVKLTETVTELAK